MGEKLVFSLFALVIIGALILITRETKAKLFGSLLVAAILIVAATYLLRFGDLNKFTLKAFSSQAEFVRDKKKEVTDDAAQIRQLKTDSMTQAEEIRHAKDQILEVEKQAKQALPEKRPVTQVTASIKLFIKGKAPFPYLPNKKTPEGNIAHLNLGESAHWQPGKRGPWVLDLVAKNVECWSSTTDADYFAEFQAEPIFNLIDETSRGISKARRFFRFVPELLSIEHPH